LPAGKAQTSDDRHGQSVTTSTSIGYGGTQQATLGALAALGADDPDPTALFRPHRDHHRAPYYLLPQLISTPLSELLPCVRCVRHVA
jgi:hypothetical protein